MPREMMDASAPGTALLLLELLDNSSSIPLTAGSRLTLAVSFPHQNVPGCAWD